MQYNDYNNYNYTSHITTHSFVVDISQSMYDKLNTGICCCIASILNLNIRANKL